MDSSSPSTATRSKRLTSSYFHISGLSDSWGDYVPEAGHFVTFMTQFDAEKNNRVAVDVTYTNE